MRCLSKLAGHGAKLRRNSRRSAQELEISHVLVRQNGNRRRIHERSGLGKAAEGRGVWPKPLKAYNFIAFPLVTSRPGHGFNCGVATIYVDVDDGTLTAPGVLAEIKAL